MHCSLVLEDAPLAKIPVPFETAYDTLASADPGDFSAVLNFTVSLPGVGTITFLGATDIRGLHSIHDIVDIHHREVVVYPCDDEKPALGEGLNKPSLVTLEKVWPRHGTSEEEEALKLRKCTERMDAEFIGYEDDKWTFKVPHFSRFGLASSDSESDSNLSSEDDYDEDRSIQQTGRSVLPAIPAGRLSLNAGDALRGVGPAGPARVFGMDLGDSDESKEYDEEEEVIPDQYITAYPRQYRRVIESDEDLDSEEEELSDSGSGKYSDSAMTDESPTRGIDEELNLKYDRFHSMRERGSLFGPELYLNRPAASPFHDFLGCFRNQTNRREVLAVGYEDSVDEDSRARYEEIYEDAVPEESPRSEQESEEEMLVERPIQGMSSERTRFTAKLAESRSANKLSVKTDKGLSMGRSFRVGWGPNGMLALPRGSHSSSIFQHTQIKQICVQEKEAPVSLVDLLESHLKLTTGQREYHEEENFYTYSLERETVDENILENIRVYEGKPIGREKQMHEIWTLVKALWGKHEGRFAGHEGSLQGNNYRHFSIGEWFKAVSSADVTKEIGLIQERGDKGDKGKVFSSIFQNLSGKRIKEAVDVALKSDDFQFSALLAQAASRNSMFQKHVRSQIDVWEQTKQFDALHPMRQNIYYLLAGEVDKVSHLVDWKRGLGMQLWYSSAKGDRTQAFSNALDQYDQAVSSSRASPPLPLHLVGKKPNAPQKDIIYHLLKHFRVPNSNLAPMLEPETWTSQPLDFQLSWHLYSVLMALGQATDQPELRYQLTMNFAHQLEVEGLWEWAIYVILNLPFSPKSPKFHRDLVVDVLSRHLHKQEDKKDDNKHKTNFLIMDLHLPLSWINSSKARYCHYTKNYLEEVKCLLQSNEWETAHSVLVQYLACPMLLIELNKGKHGDQTFVDVEEEESTEGMDVEDYQATRGSLATLTTFLDRLSKNTSSLRSWATRGGIFSEFLRLRSSVNKLKQQQQEGVAHTFSPEKLKLEITQLSDRLKSSWSITAENDRILCLRQTACYDEMCAELHSMAVYITKLVDKQHKKSNFAVATHFQPFDLKEDYLHEQLEILTAEFLSNFSRS